MDKFFSEIGVLLGLVFTLALVSVLVSRNANTSGVLTAGGTALGGLVTAATAPVTGAQINPLGNMNYTPPNNGF